MTAPLPTESDATPSCSDGSPTSPWPADYSDYDAADYALDNEERG